MKDDEVLKFVEQTCRQYPTLVNTVWIFGSRSKHQAGATSDYDIAVDWNSSDDEDWATFVGYLREKNPTLFTLDIVRFDRISLELRQRVLEEGRVIYEKNR